MLNYLEDWKFDPSKDFYDKRIVWIGYDNLPENPELWQYYKYVDGISGCTHTIVQWRGEEGWKFIYND